MTIPSFDSKFIKRIQSIVGVVLFHEQSVNNKLSLSLNDIGTQQAPATESTNETINHLLYYLPNYPNNGIVYIASNMVLTSHSDAGFHIESKVCSRAGAHIFLSEDEPVPKWNGPILTISQVIKFVMSLASEYKLGAILITSKELVPMCQTLVDMGWPHPPTPI